MTSQDFALLTAEIADLNQRLNASSRHTLAFFNQFKKFEKVFEKYVNGMKPPSPGPGPGPGPSNPPKDPKDKGGKLDSSMGVEFRTAIASINPLIKRSFATNQSLSNSVNRDLVKTSAELGVGIDGLLAEVLSLREEGFNTLNESTVKLIGRFKQSDQNTQSLIKFMSTNSLNLMLNQRQSQELAVEIASFAQVMGTRQDEMLELAASISQSVGTRGLLGTADELTQAFTNFGATLGGRGSGLVQQMNQFVMNTDNVNKLMALGIHNFEDAIAAQTDPQAQAKVVGEMAKVAAERIKSLTSGLGTGPMAAKLAEAMLQPYGGKEALVFAQIAKAMEDQKQPLDENVKALNNFNTMTESFLNGFKLVSIYVGKALEYMPKFAPALAGAVGTMLAVASAITALKFAVTMNTKALGLGGGKGGVLSFLGGWPMLLLTGVLALHDYMKGTKENTDEINKKTPDPESNQGMRSSMLSGYILSQLSNIAMSQNRGSVDREMLDSTKELVRLAKRNLDMTDPQQGLPSSPMRSNR